MQLQILSLLHELSTYLVTIIHTTTELCNGGGKDTFYLFCRMNRKYPRSQCDPINNLVHERINLLSQISSNRHCIYHLLII